MKTLRKLKKKFWGGGEIGYKNSKIKKIMNLTFVLVTWSRTNVL